MISLPLKPKLIRQEGNKAVFEIEGLYPGYGITIGNSLRRVLFSSLAGAAVTQVKIEGVHHEFSTIKGVLEDVITIITNLKALRFKMHSDEPQVATLSIKGEREVKGADLHVPTQLDLINKEASIATLTDKKAELIMDLRIEKGLGYVMVDQEKTEKLEVGQISIDSIFTPIKNVNFKVENMRVGKRTDFDRLSLEIETDGTIEPEEALNQAAEILVGHFSLFLKEEKGERETDDSIEKTKIEEMKISTRTINILSKGNIKTVAGLIRKNEESLMELEGMGQKGIEEIKKGLKKIGLRLK